VTKVAPFTGIFEKSPPVVRSDKAPGSSTLSRKNVISRKSGRSLFRVHSRVDYRGLGGGGGNSISLALPFHVLERC
jgi:hypothetical protein